jgi:hypothetical protein
LSPKLEGNASHTYYDAPSGDGPWLSAAREPCTAAVLLEVDPIGLVRGRRGPAGEGGQLEQYVNDRPYGANSFMSVTLGRLFTTALNGKSKERQQPAETAIPLIAKVPVIAARGGEDLVRRHFEPLEYALDITRLPLIGPGVFELR